MSKKNLIFIILSLSVINVYTLVCFHRSKTQQVSNPHKNISENDELHSYKLNLKTNIENSHIRLEEVAVKDSVGAVFPIKETLNNDR